MLSKVKDFWHDEEGMGTLEILIIVVVLVGLALMFKTKIVGWVRDMLDSVDSESGNMTAVPK